MASVTGSVSYTGYSREYDGWMARRFDNPYRSCRDHEERLMLARQRGELLFLNPWTMWDTPNGRKTLQEFQAARQDNFETTSRLKVGLIEYEDV